ncbi:MAG: agmatinase [Candidatus Omnitrophica bacterium]|nr:agmatinase [Candidatus Omnitrophota bacterium]
MDCGQPSFPLPSLSFNKMNKSASYNFLGIQNPSYEKTKFVILPIPYEATVSFGRGTRFGPEGIILSSRYVELFDEETKTEPYRKGIFTLPEIPIESNSVPEMFKQIERTIQKHLKKKKFIISLGGEHSLSIPVIQSHRIFYPDLKVIHFDAHADMRNVYEGSRFNHACVIRRVTEAGCEVFSFGIRSLSGEEFEYISSSKMNHVFYDIDTYDKPLENFIDNIPDGNYYLTIDLDVFDPSVVPEVGTPEPGGLRWYSSLKFIRKIIMSKNIVGVDIVELAPKHPYSPSCFFSAKFIYKIISYLSQN